APMGLTLDNVTWPPSRSPRTGVHEDRCAAHTGAPMKDWVYERPAIGFVLSGWFDYLTERRVAFGAPGAIVFGNAGEHFTVRHHDSNGNGRLVVMIRQTTLDEIANHAGLDAPRFSAIALPPGPPATRMYAAMRAMADANESGDDYEFELALAALSAPT